MVPFPVCYFPIIQIKKSLLSVIYRQQAFFLGRFPAAYGIKESCNIWYHAWDCIVAALKEKAPLRKIPSRAFLLYITFRDNEWWRRPITAHYHKIII